MKRKADKAARGDGRDDNSNRDSFRCQAPTALSVKVHGRELVLVDGDGIPLSAAYFLSLCLSSRAQLWVGKYRHRDRKACAAVDLSRRVVGAGRRRVGGGGRDVDADALGVECRADGLGGERERERENRVRSIPYKNDEAMNSRLTSTSHMPHPKAVLFALSTPRQCGSSARASVSNPPVLLREVS